MAQALSISANRRREMQFMRCHFSDRGRVLGKLLKMGVWVILMSALLLSPPLHADMPQYGMTSLNIDDQGSQLIFYWHFFYSEMPRQFLLHEKQDEPISSLEVTDPHLEQKLTDIALTAFELKINGQTITPKMVRLTPFPDNSCSITLQYAGIPYGKAELRAPIRQYLPQNYVINVRINNASGSKGYLFRKDTSPVIYFEQDRVNIPRPVAQPIFTKSFMVELGAAWVNYNWILLCAILLLMQQARQIAVLIMSIVACWICFSFAAVIDDWKMPYRIPEIILCIPTVLLCVACVKYHKRWIVISLITVAAGLLNACYDIQQLSFATPNRTINALAGLSLGFAGGIALVLLVLVPLWWECRKYPGFQENWAPKISWIIAGIAFFVPLQKLIFG